MDKTLHGQKECLALISRIASRAACSPHPERPSETLMDLSIALRHDTLGAELEEMHQELNFIDSNDSKAQNFTAADIVKFESRSTWS
jgi:hypothetical protein